ncbi:MAG TPA: hypothetical protein VGA22_00810 [Gemmatimonadales bacterium]|jgi:tetratricopeptide (TPR) repeat protein
MLRARNIVLAAAAIAGPVALTAQGTGESMSAIELERAGRFEEAVDAYVASLDSSAAKLSDVLGLERVLVRLGRLPALLPYLERAIVAAPDQEVFREAEFRARGSLFGADSVRAVAARWSAAFPSSRSPYRLLSRWLAEHGDLVAADRVLTEGEQRTGASLAEFRAQAAAEVGDWVGAARAWREAVRQNVGFLAAAASNLVGAPDDDRPRVLEVLLVGATPRDYRLAADLMVLWGRVEEAWTMLDRGMPLERGGAARVLQRFADRAARLQTPEGFRAQGLALERLAEYVEGDQVMDVRLAAARAYAAAGRPEAARRVLDRAQVGETREEQRVTATVALIDMTIAGGRLEEAERRFREARNRLSPDALEVLRARLAWGWVRAGDVDRAERVLESDSTVVSLGVRGWIAAYRGELEVARELLQAAGPAAATREDATAQTWLLVLLERIEVERAPEIGAALLLLARGDSLRAAHALVRAATPVPARGGRADLLVFAGDIATAARDPSLAEDWYRQALEQDAAGPAAPHAEYALALLMYGQGRHLEAREQLEHLILVHAESAFVPQARRLLHDVRGVIPPS